MSTDTIVIDGYEGLQQVYQEVQTEWMAATWFTTLNEITADLQTAHGNYFETESNPVGAPWAPLAPSTIAKKGHDRILFETGRLMESLTSHTSDSIRETYSETGMHGLSFGTGVEYAGFHQEGTVRIPQREHVGTDDEDLATILDVVGDEAVRILEGRSRG